MKTVNGVEQTTPANPALPADPALPVTPEPRGASIYERINRVKRDVARVSKTGKNDHFGYFFATESDIADALRTIMAEHGVCLVYHGPDLERMKITEDGQTRSGLTRWRYQLWCRYELVNTDKPEEKIEVWGYGEALDSEDKGHNKAITNAHKYVQMKAFDISTGNPSDDPDSSEHLKAGHAARSGRGNERTAERRGNGAARPTPAAAPAAAPAAPVNHYSVFAGAVREWTGLAEEDCGNACRIIAQRQGYASRRPSEITGEDWKKLVGFVRQQIADGVDWMDWVNPRDRGPDETTQESGPDPAGSQEEAPAPAPAQAPAPGNGAAAGGEAAPGRTLVQTFAARRSRHPSADTEAAHERAANGRAAAGASAE